MGIKRHSGILLPAIVAVLMTGAFAGNAHGQTKKKKTTAKTSTAKVRPVTPTSVPVIVSQADQYQQTNQAIITGVTETPAGPVVQTPQQPETLEQKIDRVNKGLKEMNTRMKSLETSKQNEDDERRKRLMMNLDILTRAEQRSESLRKQLFEIVEKENQIKLQLDTIDYDSRPDVIERQVSMSGSLRPEELRELRRKNLDSQKSSLQNLLIDVQSRRTNLEESVRKSDELVDKLRSVLEKDINDALEPQTKEQ